MQEMSFPYAQQKKEHDNLSCHVWPVPGWIVIKLSCNFYRINWASVYLNVTRPTDTEIEVGIRSKVHIENE